MYIYKYIPIYTPHLYIICTYMPTMWTIYSFESVNSLNIFLCKNHTPCIIGLQYSLPSGLTLPLTIPLKKTYSNGQYSSYIEFFRVRGPPRVLVFPYYKPLKFSSLVKALATSRSAKVANKFK